MGVDQKNVGRVHLKHDRHECVGPILAIDNMNAGRSGPSCMFVHADWNPKSRLLEDWPFGFQISDLPEAGAGRSEVWCPVGTKLNLRFYGRPLQRCSSMLDVAGVNDSKSRSVGRLQLVAQLCGYIFQQGDSDATFAIGVVVLGIARVLQPIDVFRRQGVHVSIEGVDNQPADQATKENIPADIPAICSRIDRNGLGGKAGFGDIDQIVLAPEIASAAFVQSDGSRSLALEDLRAFLIGNENGCIPWFAADGHYMSRTANDGGTPAQRG